MMTSMIRAMESLTSTFGNRRWCTMSGDVDEEGGDEGDDDVCAE